MNFDFKSQVASENELVAILRELNAYVIGNYLTIEKVALRLKGHEEIRRRFLVHDVSTYEGEKISFWTAPDCTLVIGRNGIEKAGDWVDTGVPSEELVKESDIQEVINVLAILKKAGEEKIKASNNLISLLKNFAEK